jgi:hypothetical protein
MIDLAHTSARFSCYGTSLARASECAWIKKAAHKGDVEMILRIGMVIAMVAALVSSGSAPSQARDDRAAVAIVGAIVGAAALAAASKSHRHEHHRTHFHNRGYGGRQFSGSFSPHSGVVCYYSSRTCYRDGRFAPHWTRRSF